MDDPEPSHASSNEPSEVTRLAQPSDEPASALSRASLFLANDSTASANDSRATSPGGETDQLASSDDDELEVPLKDQQATSEGGAIAGPGPSSSSMKRPLSPSPPTASNDGGSAAASNVAPPAKKKRGRASIPLVSNSYYPPPFPHYTVTRATGKNTKTNRHVLSINPDVTDGMQSRWPQEHEYDPKNKQDGKINWYERQPKDEGRHELWLKTAGDKMAAKLGLSEEGEFWILESLPKNYLFVIHHSSSGSSNQPRVDPYAFGSPVCAKFRSGNEIIPHLLWLIEHGPGKHRRCGCRYCSKKSQTEVNKDQGMDLSRNVGPRTSTPSAATQPSKKPKRTGAGAAAAASSYDKKPNVSSASAAASVPKGAVRSRTFNSASPEPSYSGAFVDKQRDSDLQSGAKFRKGEMVWAQIPQGTLVFSSPSTKSMTGAAGGDRSEESKVCVTHWPAIVENREERTESKVEYPYISGGIPKFLNVKRWVYEVHYLGTKNKATAFEEDDVKAWLDTSVPDNVWATERLVSPETLDFVWDGNRMRKAELSELKALEQAVAPLAFAMQMSAHVMSSFSVIDRFVIKDGHFVTPPDDETVSEQARLEMQRAKNNWFYQSIYFGAELIWVNDFVRVIHHRDQELPPHHRLSKGSHDRALFMQVHAIWKDQESGVVKLTGQIYELKDLLDNDENAGVGVVSEPVGGLGAMSMFEKKSPPAVAGGGGSPLSGSGGSGGTTAGQNGVEGEAGQQHDEQAIDETSTPPHTAGLTAFHATPLPRAPEGFEFHRVTPGESQITVSLDYLAGRYYPLAHDLNSRAKIDRVAATFPYGPVYQEVEVDGEVVEKKKSDAAMEDPHRAIALAGLVPAFALYSKATRWKGDRMTALTDAETLACSEFANCFEQAMKQ